MYTSHYLILLEYMYWYFATVARLSALRPPSRPRGPWTPLGRFYRVIRYDDSVIRYGDIKFRYGDRVVRYGDCGGQGSLTNLVNKKLPNSLQRHRLFRPTRAYYTCSVILFFRTTKYPACPESDSDSTERFPSGAAFRTHTAMARDRHLR